MAPGHQGTAALPRPAGGHPGAAAPRVLAGRRGGQAGVHRAHPRPGRFPWPGLAGLGMPCCVLHWRRSHLPARCGLVGGKPPGPNRTTPPEDIAQLFVDVATLYRHPDRPVCRVHFHPWAKYLICQTVCLSTNTVAFLAACALGWRVAAEAPAGRGLLGGPPRRGLEADGVVGGAGPGGGAGLPLPCWGRAMVVANATHWGGFSGPCTEPFFRLE